MIKRSRQSLLKVGLFALITLVALHYASTNSPRHIYSHANRAHRAQNDVGAGDVIPNYVHFVHILPDSSRNSDEDIAFELRHFLAIYSSLLHFQPETIFIHTDASVASIERARTGAHNATSTWAYKILTLPSVVVRHVVAPSVTTKGIKITRIQHKSDFVRTRAVLEYGGIYLDWDVYALRPVAVLRESGFANVVGRQKLGAVNSGFWMSRKGSALMREWAARQDEVYTGGWTIHSNDLLSSIAERNDYGGRLAYLAQKFGLIRETKEVLNLERNAFAPSSWELVDAKALFEAHPGELVDESSNPAESTTNNTFSSSWDSVFPRNRRKFRWEIDYSDSYVLHAFKAVEDQKIENFDPEGITMRYLLARNSNFASAVYPAVKHAIEAGYISVND